MASSLKENQMNDEALENVSGGATDKLNGDFRINRNDSDPALLIEERFRRPISGTGSGASANPNSAITITSILQQN